MKESYHLRFFQIMKSIPVKRLNNGNVYYKDLWVQASREDFFIEEVGFNASMVESLTKGIENLFSLPIPSDKRVSISQEIQEGYYSKAHLKLMFEESEGEWIVRVKSEGIWFCNYSEIPNECTGEGTFDLTKDKWKLYKKAIREVCEKRDSVVKMIKKELG